MLHCSCPRPLVNNLSMNVSVGHRCLSYLWLTSFWFGSSSLWVESLQWIISLSGLFLLSPFLLFPFSSSFLSVHLSFLPSLPVRCDIRLSLVSVPHSLRELWLTTSKDSSDGWGTYCTTFHCAHMTSHVIVMWSRDLKELTSKAYLVAMEKMDFVYKVFIKCDVYNNYNYNNVNCISSTSVDQRVP